MFEALFWDSFTDLWFSAVTEDRQNVLRNVAELIQDTTLPLQFISDFGELGVHFLTGSTQPL
jgi:hypothetical protein